MELKQLCNLNHPKRNDCIRCYHWENPECEWKEIHYKDRGEALAVVIIVALSVLLTLMIIGLV